MSRLRCMTAIAGAVALMGCASVAPERPAGPFVVPSQTVRHGMDADAHYRTGRYFQGQVRFDLAIDAYRRVLAAQPDHVDALNALGVIHSMQQQPELAEQYFRLALAADPLAARVHNNLGYHLLKSGRGAEAIVAFEKARELEPGNADTQANLLAARVAMGLPGDGAMGASAAAAPATPPAVQVTTPTPAATATTVPVALDRVCRRRVGAGIGQGLSCRFRGCCSGHGDAGAGNRHDGCRAGHGQGGSLQRQRRHRARPAHRRHPRAGQRRCGRA